MKTSTTTINDWRPETKSLVARLVDAGCTIVRGDNGEDEFKFTGDMDAFIAELIACDESHLFVITPHSGTNQKWIYLVFGNSPGELPSDYIVDQTLDEVTKAHYNEWELKGQPKARGYYENGKWVDA